MINKIIKISLASLICFVSITFISNQAITANEGVGEQISFPQQPKEVRKLDGTLSIRDVFIKGKDAADQDALTQLRAFFVTHGVVEKDSEEEAETIIYLGEVGDTIVGLPELKAELELPSAKEQKAEGYVLASNADKNIILIEGKDGDGTFYGIQTLKQMIRVSNGSLQLDAVIVKDEPTMKTRGSIEGFYGTPWTHQDRLNQIIFYGDTKMNTYIYAPKDDEYHREKWREPYPESEMARMNELVQTSKENKVDFVFALSPGIDLRFDGANGEADFQSMMSKCESLYAMGVRDFAIFFDDINDKSGVKQASFLNRFHNEFVKMKGDVSPLVTVPTDYWTNGMINGSEVNKYTADFSSTLDPNIIVLWTGSAVVPEGIDVANTQFVKSIYGNRMGVWWNYPVTDYIKNKLALGPIYGLDKGLQNELDYFVMNPMEHADLSKISLSTGADYAWNTSAYDYEASFDAAISHLYGTLAPEMKTFANHSTRLEEGWASTGRADAPEVREAMNTMIKKVARGQDAKVEINYLRQEFADMIHAADTLTAQLSAEDLKHSELSLKKLKALGESDQLALDLFLAKIEGNQTTINALTTTLNTKLPALKSGNRVSENVALSFVSEALNYDPMPTAGFEVSKTFVVPNEEIQLINTSSVSSTEFKWEIKGAKVETFTEENPIISFSREGVYTVTLKAKNSLDEHSIVKTGIITVSNEAQAENINLSLGKTATASGFTAQSEAPGKAIDGVYNTKWCATGNRVHTLTIDLKEAKTISNVKISHAEIGGEGAGLNTKNYRISVSNNGTDFVELVKVVNNVAGETNDQLPVISSRYIRLSIDKATQGSDTAARIYEVEVFGLDKLIDLPAVFVPANKTLLKSASDIASEITEQELAEVIPVVVQEFQVALAEANAILADTAVTQKEVDASFKRLTSAVQKLDFKKGDKANLILLMDTVGVLDETLYTPSTWKPFATQVAASKAVISDENAMQEEVSSSYDNLMKTFMKLRLIPNKNLLGDLVKQADNFDEKLYTKRSFDSMLVAKKAAIVVLDDKEVTETKVKQTEQTLSSAIEKLEKLNSGSVKPGDDTSSNTVKPSTKPGNVSTGDDTNRMMLLILGVSSVLLIVVMRKKKSQNS